MPRVTSEPSAAASAAVPRRGQEVLLVGDVVVGRQDDHHVVHRPLDRQSGEGDGRGGVAAERLADQVPPEERARLLGHQRQVALVGNHICFGGAHQRRDAFQRQLEEALVTQQRQERLGPRAAAERPQTGPAAAGQYHGIHSPIVGERHPAALSTRWGRRMPPSSASSWARSVRSQGRSRSGRPKWP